MVPAIHSAFPPAVVLLTVLSLSVSVSAVNIDNEVKAVLTAALTRDINNNNHFDDSNNVPESLSTVDEARQERFRDYHDDVIGMDIYYTRHSLSFTTEGFTLYKFHYTAVYEERGPENRSPGIRLISMSKVGKSGGSYGLMASDPNKPGSAYMLVMKDVVAAKMRTLSPSSALELEHIYAVGVMRPSSRQDYFSWVVTCRTSLGAQGKAYWKWVVRLDGYPNNYTGGRGSLTFHSFDSESVYVVNADPILAHPPAPVNPPVPINAAAMSSLEMLITQSLDEWDVYKNSVIKPNVVKVISALQFDFLDYRVASLFDVYATKYESKFIAEFMPGRYTLATVAMVYQTPLDGSPHLVTMSRTGEPSSSWGSAFIDSSLNTAGRPPFDMANEAVSLYNQNTPDNFTKVSKLKSVIYASDIGHNYFAVAIIADTLLASDVTFKWMLKTSGNIDSQTGKTGSLSALSIVSQSASVTGSRIKIPSKLHDITGKCEYCN